VSRFAASLQIALRHFFPPVCIGRKTRTCPSAEQPKTIGSTHTRELDATVTALGSSTLLLDVEVPERAAGGLDDADLVGPRVVPVDEIRSISCS
jgi:hypothetical protein